MLALRMPWPLPALVAWACAWLIFVALQRAVPPVAALLVACLLGTAASVLGDSWWRRGLIAAGFPLSLALLGAASLPTWAWLVPLALLLLVYPLNAWRDAPLFPTPHHALRHAYPAAQLEGIEWSWPLRLLCALRCPWAQVRRADMWAEDWSPYRMVYLFQRPESMARAAGKAHAELATGAWLVSLEFAVPGVLPCAQLRAPGGRVVWLYRMPLNRVEA